VNEAPSIDERFAGLPRPLGHDSRETVERVRGCLSDVRGWLEALHRSGASGRRVNEAHSDLTDRLVRRLHTLADESILAEGGEIETGVSVVAVGGYARREMSIQSDVDLLVLYRDDLTPYVQALAERLLYWLWDAGLTVGCATRTIAETVALGHEDVTVRTAVLTARFLCGDGEFFHEFADATRAELLPDPLAFIDERIEARKRRHERYGESLFLLQPNVKEGAGALRDYHDAYWVARAAQPSIRDVDDWLHFGLLTEAELADFRGALDFLWRTRNELHLIAGRATDQMSFELQEQVAEGLGYGSPASTDDTVLEGGVVELSVERFMRDYYRHARVIQSHSELVMDQCRARVAPQAGPRVVEAEEDGFQRVAGHLEIPHAAHLRDDRRRLLRAFEVAQRWDVPLSRMALRRVHEALPLVDDAMQRDPECAASFLRILEAEHRVMRTLMAMNDVGLLGAYLPEWDHIVCRWLHVMYHTYTVDVHSIFLVEELRRLEQGKFERALPELSAVVREVDDRSVLYLGCLLHDIGKGYGGNHSERGAGLAARCLARLGLEGERAERVLFIVRHHLLMSHLAQRRDLSDPKLILEFAQLCGDRTNLRNLYLATFADVRASSRDAWTQWKGDLLRELFERTSEFLETGADDSTKAMELMEARVERRRAGAREELRTLGVGEGKIEAFFESMPRRYFLTHTPRQIARHAQVVLRYQPERSCALAIRSMKGGFTELIVCARDVHGLYAQVAGTIASNGLNILASNVYTTREQLALEVYRVTTPAGGREEREMVWRALEDELERVLRGDLEVEALLQRRGGARRSTRPPRSEPPRVLVTNAESDFYTLVDVTAEDRVGLLHDLTRTLGEFDLEIFVSKAATIRDQAADSFYVRDPSGRKLSNESIARVERALWDLVRAPGAGEDG